MIISTEPTELYDLVPKTYLENLQYRLKVYRWAAGNPEAQEILYEACQRDFFFWLATFCWVYEPRNKGVGTILPFIPWPHQIPAMGTMIEVLQSEEQGDVGLEKSRGEGASWMVLMIFLYCWIFSETPMSFGLVSRSLDMADNPDDMSSLFSKIDWQLKRLPYWMAGIPDRDYKRTLNKHSLVNFVNDAGITAYPCTPDMAAGGRLTAFLMDELGRFERGKDEEAMGASEPVTDCRFLVSTYNGPHGSYYDMMHDDEATMVKIVLRWEENPTRNRGLYRFDKSGRAVAVDPINNPLPLKYLDPEYVSDIKRKLDDKGYDTSPDKIRSPWYDSRCLRPNMDPRKIAQEYDRDPGGSAARFFNIKVIERLIKETARPPTHVGDLRFDTETWKVKFIPDEGGRMRLWLDLNFMGLPTPDDFIVSADSSQGLGGTHGSNSTLTGVRTHTGEKVLEWASPTTLPTDHADLAIAVCHFLSGPHMGPAYMIWEDMGPGRSFRQRILETDFRNFYMRYKTDSITKKPTSLPGWSGAKAAKGELLGRYRRCLTDGTFLNTSALALRECKFYIVGPGDRIMHVGEDSADPSGALNNHGDRVTADALACWAMKDRGRSEPEPKPETTRVPRNCFRARQLARQAADVPDYWERDD